MLSALSKLPFVGPLFGFVLDKGRLVLEYALLATVVTLAGVTFTLWVQKGQISDKLSETETRVGGLEASVTTQSLTINTLRDLRQKDNQALAGLMQDYRMLSQNDSAVRNRLKALEQTNEVVRKYLESPIPPELLCVLNNTCPASADNQVGARAAAGSASGAVRGR